MPDTEMAQNMFLFSDPVAADVSAVRSSETVCLIEKVCAGDREAFGELYKQFAPVVHGILLLRVPYSEVPDIVQEVFVAAYQSLNTLRDRRAFPGWLARIARNRASEFHRSKRPSEELDERSGGTVNASAEALEILDAIRSLPETYRETLVLRLVEGMTGAEIAERTGMTHESVRVNLHRGMERLRTSLGIAGRRK